MTRVVSLVVRWLARGVALLVAGTYLLLVSGEILSAHSGPPAQLREWAGMVLLACAMAALLLAWKWELPGALLSLATLAAFLVVARMHRSDTAMLAAAPGVLFLVDWILRRIHPLEAMSK